MIFDNETTSEAAATDVNPTNEDTGKPNAYLVDDDHNLEEKDLEKNFLFNSENDKPNQVREGQGDGGQKFGQNNLTPAGNDKNNPSQYAGNTNPYFDRKEPSEEHPEDGNFTAKDQEGSPDYDKAQPNLSNIAEDPKPEKPEERGNGENDRPHEQETYVEGTVDNDEDNVPGEMELPDQQKVGKDVSDEEFDEDHEEK